MLLIVFVLLFCLSHLSAELTVWDSSVQANAPQEWNFNSGSEQVWFEDALLYEKYLGKRSIEFNASFDYNSQFRICSNSKLFTSVAILQLVERGQITSIFDNINDYLNETDFQAWGLPKNTTKWCPQVYGDVTGICQNVTFVSLMSMSSGVLSAITCSYNPSQWQYQYCLPPSNCTVYPGSIATSISYFIKNPLSWAPGPTYGPGLTNTYFYANENFIILSYMVQKMSGLSLSDYFQQHIWTPMGLENTFFDPWSQAFQIKPNMASEYFFYTNYYNGSVETDEAFAYGSCSSVEANAGYQSGSGGMVSTASDMVKWYTSLFISKNTTVLTDESVSLLIFPWSLEEGQPIQYYGLGVEMLFEEIFVQQPSVAMVYSLPPPISIYYMGGSVCSFFSIVIYNATFNYFTGQPLQTLPMVSAVARNNRIMNVTQKEFFNVPNLLEGSWFTVTDFPIGWGSSNPDLTDTFMEALNLAMYFAAYSYVPQSSPTMSPTTAIQSNGDNKDDDEIAGMNGVHFVLIVTLIPCFAIMVMIVAYFCVFWAPKGSTNDVSLKIESVDNPLKLV